MVRLHESVIELKQERPFAAYYNDDMWLQNN